jgi:hypothetical protein
MGIDLSKNKVLGVLFVVEEGDFVTVSVIELYSCESWIHVGRKWL